MILLPLTDAGEIRSAFQKFAAGLKQGARPLRCTLGWKGGRATVTVNWQQRRGFWGGSRMNPGEGHYWCPFGTRDTANAGNFRIIVEINSPKRGRNLRCGGVFARDPKGRVWITHTGRVGGGRKGIGKRSFLAYYPQNRAYLKWPDGEQTEVVQLGMLTDVDGMNAAIGRFVGAVREYKGLTETRGTTGKDWLPGCLRFTPEFSGRRKAYQAGGWVRSTATHGKVVTALHAVLKARGFTAYNDQRRDLFLYERGATACLFEVKTDIGTNSIYKGVGQLLLHAASDRGKPTCVLVVPNDPTEMTQRALDEIGILVLTYKSRKGRVTFINLDGVPGMACE